MVITCHQHLALIHIMVITDVIDNVRWVKTRRKMIILLALALDRRACISLVSWFSSLILFIRFKHWRVTLYIHCGVVLWWVYCTTIHWIYWTVERLGLRDASVLFGGRGVRITSIDVVAITRLSNPNPLQVLFVFIETVLTFGYPALLSLFLPRLKSFIELFFFQLLFYLFLGVLVIVLMRVVPSDLSFCELGVAGVACVLHVRAETTAVLAERGKRSVCLSGQRHTLFLQDFACCVLFWLRNGETANST